MPSSFEGSALSGRHGFGTIRYPPNSLRPARVKRGLHSHWQSAGFTRLCVHTINNASHNNNHCSGSGLILGFCTVQFLNVTTFRRNLLPPSSLNRFSHPAETSPSQIKTIIWSTAGMKIWKHTAFTGQDWSLLGCYAVLPTFQRNVVLSYSGSVREEEQACFSLTADQDLSL
jgi:hypothetical protein